MLRILILALAFALVACKGTYERNGTVTRAVCDAQCFNKLVFQNCFDADVHLVSDENELRMTRVQEECEVQAVKRETWPVNRYAEAASAELQVFYFDVSRDTIFRCAQGTLIGIPANTIQRCDGGLLSSVLRLEVQEFYLMEDILLAGLSTMSDDKLLETGGMLHLRVLDGSHECTLKDAERIDLAFPADTKQADMKLFDGYIKDNSVNWVLQKDSVSGLERRSFFSGTASPVKYFPGGERQLERYFVTHPAIQLAMAQSLISINFYFRFSVDEEGQACNLELPDELNEIWKNAMHLAVLDMPKFEQSGSQDKPNQMQMTLPLRVIAPNQSQAEGYWYPKSLGSFSTSGFDRFVANKTMNVFSSSGLGWINCDRFLEEPGKLINISVPLSAVQDAEVFLVFRNIRSVMAPAWNAQTQCLIFRNIPEKQNFVVCAMKRTEDKVFLALTETSPVGEAIIDLQFDEMTLGDLRNRLACLHK